MYISRAEIYNYKSFYKSGPIELKPGFNIIVGPNNAGKTALIEALSLSLEAVPHRTQKTIPYRGSPVDPPSSVDVSFTIDAAELLEIIGKEGTVFHVAQPEQYSSFGNYDGSEASGRIFMRRMMEQHNLTFALRFTRNAGDLRSWTVPNVPSYGLYKARPLAALGTWSFIRIKFGNGDFHGMLLTNGSPGDDVGMLVARAMQPRLYRFTAERFNLARGHFGDQAVLFPNASNLPQVLDSLQGRNPERFRELNQLLRRIFPQIYMISVRPARQEVEIIVWTVDPASQREDLATPLDESGTGIGQVLAILYAVLTADEPQVILIDEPQSFLHPGAVRKLIDILKDYPQHQYIVATHSPTVIAASNPSTITSVMMKDGESTLKSIDPKQTSDLKTCLADVGARLSDVFGADNILWVEGKTEEICFPQILEKIAKQHLMGTAIVGLRSTGELEGRDVDRVFDIYDRISKSNSLLPRRSGLSLTASAGLSRS